LDSVLVKSRKGGDGPYVRWGKKSHSGKKLTDTKKGSS